MTEKDYRKEGEEMEKKKKKKYSRTDKVILGIGFTILGLFVLSIAIPIIYVVLASFMDPTVLNNQGLSFNIKDWTLDAYRRVLENEMIWRGFLNSFLYSLAFTVISVFVTLLAAYPLSKKEFVGRKVFNIIFLITMFFGGGMIPTFLLYKQLGLTNSFGVYVIPGMVSAFNMLVIRTYMNGISDSLEESAQLDGAGYTTIFLKIYSPLCKPVYATVALFVAVGQWNSWFDAMLYNRMNSNLTTLQYELMKLLSSVTNQGTSVEAMKNAAGSVTPTSVRAAATIITMLPIICIYPFLQKYFVAGLTLGGVKE